MYPQSKVCRRTAFNILNHPNFANPGDGTAPGRLTFSPGLGFGSANETLANGLGPSNVLGQLSSLFQIGGPRSMQFALRLRFKEMSPFRHIKILPRVVM